MAIVESTTGFGAKDKELVSLELPKIAANF